MKKVLIDLEKPRMRVLHVAPESFLRPILENHFEKYFGADLERMDVDLRLDLQALPFTENTFDCVFASHVLEHIPDDRKAIREIRRILGPQGVAFLPVPVVAKWTVEYPAPNPNESGHVRAPGLDYFDRLREVFPRVELYSSSEFPEQYQTFVRREEFTAEEREGVPRPTESIVRVPDVVPVCLVTGSLHQPGGR